MLRDVTRRRSGAGDVPLPRIFAPQLATLVDTAPEGDEWLHELKFDGYRIGCRIDGRTVSLISRNGKDWTDHFPEVDRKSTRLNSSHTVISYAVFCLKKKNTTKHE